MCTIGSELERRIKKNRDHINPADLSADKVPDFSSFFIGRQNKYNYLVIIFSIGRQFLGFGNRPMIGR